MEVKEILVCGICGQREINLNITIKAGNDKKNIFK